MSCSLFFALALSSHFGLEAEYNEIHPAVKCDRDDSGVIFGGYLNSEDKASLYGGWKVSSENPDDNLWLEVGIVSGYSSSDVLPYARFGYDLSPNTSVFLAPAIEETRDDYLVGAVLGIEIKIRK